MAVVSRPIRPDRGSFRGPRLGWLGSLFTTTVFLLAILATALLVQQGLVWGQRSIDDVRYGFPRTAQIEGVIAPGDAPSQLTHIVALNLNGQVSVLVLPNGDASRVQPLAGPYLVGRDGPYVVPLPSLQDVNGDGLSDLLVTLRGETVVYINEAGTLRMITPEERVQLEG